MDDAGGLGSERDQPDPCTEDRPAGALGRILLVEHDSAFRSQLREALTTAGYDVECVEDGAEALARLERGPPPEAIVIDMILPGVNGFVFRSLQLQSPELRRVPAVLLSAVRTPPGAEDIPFQAVISETTAVDDLVESVNRLCSRG